MRNIITTAGNSMKSTRPLFCTPKSALILLCLFSSRCLIKPKVKLSDDFVLNVSKHPRPNSPKSLLVFFPLTIVYSIIKFSFSLMLFTFIKVKTGSWRKAWQTFLLPPRFSFLPPLLCSYPSSSLQLSLALPYLDANKILFVCCSSFSPHSRTF